MTKSESKATVRLLDLPSLCKYREASSKVRDDLDKLFSSKLPRYTTEDTSLVVFGSLARGEWTSKSDLDWTYLIDGEANSDHLRIGQQIQSLLKDNKYVDPGPTGTFGNMTFSHALSIKLAVRTIPTKTPLSACCFCSNHAGLGKAN
jgi:predicted nucleotidyltransferase